MPCWLDSQGGGVTADRVNDVMELVEGFASAYGLELLATVHWAAIHELGTREADPAALTELIRNWSERKGRLLLHHNDALDIWSGGWYTATDAADRHLVAYLFSESARVFLPDVHVIRRASVAMLRYQYTRNLSPRFRSIIGRLAAGSPEAADLWARHEVAFAPHEYAVRLRADRGIVDAHVLFTPLSPRLWSFTMVLPPGIRPP